MLPNVIKKRGFFCDAAEERVHAFIRDGWVSLTNLRTGQDLTHFLKDFATHEQHNLIVVN
jgi:hypothetical protein